MIPVGTQYYRPPTPRAEFWEADFKLMQECGFNTVRGWAMWSWLNPREGQYDFSEIDRLLGLGARHEIGVILLVNIESSPAWLFSKHPEKLYVSKSGSAFVPQTVHNTSVGGFPGQCTDYPEIKAAAVDFITELVGHCRDHPALAGWEPHNEPLLEPARYSHEVYCYCPQTIQVFRDWLRRKYEGSIDKLNAIWQRRFADFDEVIPPYQLGSFADWMDWRTFAIDNLVAQDAWRIKAIRESDPDHPVLMHSRAGGDRRDTPCDCTDDWALAALADKFGYANFPQGRSIFEHLLSGDVCRSAAQGKEFWMHELQSGPFGIGLQRNNPFFAFLGDVADVDVTARPDEVGDVTADRLALWSLMPFSQGAKGLIYWQFRTEQFGTECGFNLVNLDGTPTPRLDMAKRIAAFVNDNETLLAEARPPASKVAIGYSVPNVLMTFAAEGNVNPYFASYLGANRVLQHVGHQVDAARIDVLAVDDDLGKYDVLVLPLPIFADEATAGKLADYVSGGGTLIAEASCAEFDAGFFSSDRVPGMGLDEVFGCHREIISTKNEITINWRGLPIPSRFYEEILIPDTGEVAATYPDGRPAAVINTCGKGKAVYFGTNVLMDYIVNEDVNLMSVMADLTGSVRRFARTDNRMAVVRWMQSGDCRLVFLFNGDYRKQTCTLTLNAEVPNARDVWNEEDVQFVVNNGSSEKTFHLDPYAVKILKTG